MLIQNFGLQVFGNPTVETVAVNVDSGVGNPQTLAAAPGDGKRLVVASGLLCAQSAITNSIAFYHTSVSASNLLSGLMTLAAGNPAPLPIIVAPLNTALLISNSTAVPLRGTILIATVSESQLRAPV